MDELPYEIGKRVKREDSFKNLSPPKFQGKKRVCKSNIKEEKLHIEGNRRKIA
jgi:hypothetical protein